MSARIALGLRTVCKGHQWFTTMALPKHSLLTRNAMHMDCTQFMQISASSKRIIRSKLGIAPGVARGLLASFRQTKAMSAIANEKLTDPTTIETGWLPKTEEIYAKLLARVQIGELRLVRTTKEPLDRVVYTLSHPQKGAHFEYALFLEESTQKGIGVIQFGPHTQGPEGYVHGGAAMTMIDGITGVFVNRGLGKSCVTANMNINFGRPIPLNSTVLAEMWVENIERKKHLLRCEIKSTEGQVYNEGTALWIEIKKH